MDDVYEFVYYVPFMAEAMVQLWLLCDVEAQSQFRSFLCKVLKYVRGGGIRSGGGNRQRGEGVYFCYLFELWQIRRILGSRFMEAGGYSALLTRRRHCRELFPKNIYNRGNSAG